MRLRRQISSRTIQAMQRNLVRPTPSAAQGIAMADIQGPLLQPARLQSSPRRAQRRRLHPGSLVLCLKHSTGAQVAQPRAAGIKTKMGDLGCDQSTAPYTRPHCESRCDGHWLLLVSHRCNRMYSLLLTMPSSLPHAFSARELSRWDCVSTSNERVHSFQDQPDILSSCCAPFFILSRR